MTIQRRDAATNLTSLAFAQNDKGGRGRELQRMVSGTVTFVFTDMEGSTQRWERERTAMGEALRRHDALMRNAIAAHGGEVFKTLGDAFCAVFSTAPGALRASLDAQRGLSSEDFSAIDGAPVRMALHTGIAEVRDGDYFGPVVNRVARLLAVAHGGQVVVSSTTAELLHGELPPECSLRDLGAHKLKDLARPERIYQLVASGLRESFPPLRSLDELPNNLPLQLTSFLGREDDVHAIKALVRDDRLVTLVGAGGAGKTRCAVQIGADLLDAFPNGVWLIELAPISDPALVGSAIAQELNVRESPNEPLLDTLVASLKHRRLLLLLDNCEHVIDAARTVTATILRTCPLVRILATSRESLNVGGEQVYRLPSLAVPPAREAVTAQAARSFGAVALFADRASASDTRFTLTDENSPFVTEIAQRLDGIPLAIELAAARIKVLSPRELAQKLDERFRVLTGGDRSALPRHQTMRALIDWSYDLLSEEERTLFRKLSIFAGGCTLESATAICGGETLDEFAVLELLTSLVDKSLVQTDPSGDVTRYRLLESTRQYAREKLDECGEYALVARAHASAFLELAKRLERAYDSMPENQWFAQVEQELENWRAALDWALTARGDAVLGQRLASALGREWAFSATAEGRRWIRTALESAGEATPAEVIAQLELCEARLDGVFGLHMASFAAAQRALARYRELGDTVGFAQAQRHIGLGLVFMGRVLEGEKVLHEALATFRKVGTSTLAGAALESLAVARNARGDSAGARAYFAEALEIFKANGAERLAAALANNLAELEFRSGNAKAALRLAGDVLSADVRAIFTHRTGFLMCNMAAYLVALECYDEARSRAREAITVARDRRYEVAVIWALQHLAAVAALRPNADSDRRREDRRRAARLLSYTDACLSSLEATREYTEQQEYEKIQAALRASLGNELAALTEEGRAWNEDQAVAEALLV